jgi:hypothetical protein
MRRTIAISPPLSTAVIKEENTYLGEDSFLLCLQSSMSAGPAFSKAGVVGCVTITH